MPLHQVNHRLIDQLRRYEGWRDLVNYFENEYISSIERAVSARSDREVVEAIMQSRAMKSVLAFLRAEPKEGKTNGKPGGTR